MITRTLLCVLLMVGHVAQAQEPTPVDDVPVVLTQKEFNLTLSRLARLDAENKVMKEEIAKAPPPVWVAVAVGIASLLAGAAIGYGVAQAVPPPVK